MDEMGIALLTSDFGEVWARYDFTERVAQNRSDFGQHVAQNRVQLWATGCTKSHTTLGKI